MKDDVLFTYQFLKKDKRDDISSCPQKKKKTHARGSELEGPHA